MQMTASTFSNKKALNCQIKLNNLCVGCNLEILFNYTSSSIKTNI